MTEPNFGPNPGIVPGSIVIAVFHSPREKCWGRLDEITSAGVFMRGLDLSAYDDWLKAIVEQEAFLSAVDLFFPMWRVERISLDEESYGIPSLAQQAERRSGQSIELLLSGR
jgi:hypothetical protein